MADINDILRQMQMQQFAQNQATAAKSITKGGIPLLGGAADYQANNLSMRTGWADNSIGGQGGPFGSLLSSGGTYGCRGPGAVRAFANSLFQGAQESAKGAPAFMAAMAHQQSAMTQIAYTGDQFTGSGIGRSSPSFVNMARPGGNEIV